MVMNTKSMALMVALEIMMALNRNNPVWFWIFGVTLFICVIIAGISAFLCTENFFKKKKRR